MDEREKQDVRYWMTEKGWEAVKEPSRIRLDRIPLSMQTRIPYVVAEARLESNIDHDLDQMVVRLESHVLAFERGRKPYVAPFTTEVQTMETVVGVRHDWKPLLWLILLAAVPLAPFMVSAGIIAIVILGMCLTWEDERLVTVPPEIITVSGKVVVPVTFYDAFPECKIKFPPEMGRPVEIAVWEPTRPYLRITDREENDDG